MANHSDPWDGEYGDPEGDPHDSHERLRDQYRRIQEQARKTACGRQPMCAVPGCNHRANFGFHGECTLHTIDRIVRENGNRR